ncbi:MAG: FMN-binding protein [Butyricicoccus sp.]
MELGTLFWTRVANAALIVAVLLGYQVQAQSRAQTVAEQELQTAAQPIQAEDSVSGGYADGEYTGTAAGFGGDLTVSVIVSGGAIADVQIVSTADDAEYIDKASALLQEIVDNQGADGLDAVSGATFSSNGILDAFRNAMEGQ